MGEKNLDSTKQTSVDASNQKQQQQTLAGKQQYPSYSATTPAWGDRIVKKQLAEDKNNDSGVSSDHWNDNSPGSERSFIISNFLSSPESSISQEASAMPKNNNKFELMSRHGGYKNCRSPDEFSSYRETIDDRPEESTNGLSVISSDYDVKLTQDIKCSMCDFSTINKFKLMEHLTDHCAEFRSSSSNSNLAKVVEQLQSLQEENSQGEHSKQFNNEETEEPGLRTPRVNAQGKVKTFRCKQCNFTAITKLDFWQHSRVHIKVEKLLTCPKCPFVTEYKHHLEYHMHNHVGSKPFKCDQCAYSCVNKSMLNSHMKSHSNVYQYRCADCTYVTKYCHSLKLHLRKYIHNPAMVLNADGTPNPGPIIDVYGTRRGPKQRPRTCTITQSEATSNTSTSIDQSNDSSNGNAQVSLIAPAQQSLTFQMVAANGTNSVNEENPSGASQSQTVSPYIYDQLLTAFKMSNQLLLHENGTYRPKTPPTSSVVTSPITPTNGDLYMSQELIEQAQEVLDYDTAELRVSDLSAPNFQSPDIKKEESKSEPLDLSKSSLGTGSPGIGKEDLQESATSSSKIAGTSRRRKGIAIKLEHRLMMDDTDEETAQNEKSCESPIAGSFDSREVESANDEAVADNWLHNGYVCRYCEISFRNEGMYTVHMGYHGFQEPYTCNLCGLNCTDKMSFYLHINRRTGHM